MRGRVAMLAKMPAEAVAQAPPAKPIVISSPDITAIGNRAAENAVRSASDAFGTRIGRETIGLCNSRSVRGFSTTAAGDVCITGLYVDHVAWLDARLRRMTNIRVGLSALGIPFPAPTGIVDYGFRTPGDDAAISLLVSGGRWGSAPPCGPVISTA